MSTTLPELEFPFLGIDQSGNHYRIARFPRKELMEQMGYKSAAKMYRDVNNQVIHTGYVIGPYWITVYGLEGKVFATIQ